MDPTFRREAFELSMSRIASWFSRYEARLKAGQLAPSLLPDLPHKN